MTPLIINDAFDYLCHKNYRIMQFSRSLQILKHRKNRMILMCVMSYSRLVDIVSLTFHGDS